MVRHGFKELRLHRISATVVDGNEGSRRVVETLGFILEWTKRDDDFVGSKYVDSEVYAALSDEWVD